MDTERKKTALQLPFGEVENLIRSGDGEAALLYLYLRSTGQVLELSSASNALSRTEAQISESAAKLRMIGAFPASANALPQPDELPEYRSEEIVQRGGEDAAFKSLIGEAQQILGHILSMSELKTLYGIYDHLGLPPEVILLLLHHCADVYTARYGEGRRPTMRVIEREAFTWVNREIMTLDTAEAYISRQNQRETGIRQVCAMLGIGGRALSPTEKRYITEWLDMGFPLESIELAYDRTTTNTGSLKWKYMDSILRSWFAKGLLLPEDINKMDKRGANASASGKSAKAYESDGEQARVERMLEQLKRNG